jgi:catechol 2,3-dioxygenase-like lactoylglutathione lyase family enzyme|tara:strand:+ start:430 stop:765 length:336 start_codon:yes stop_codon:yes gene_type:complete
MKKLSQVDHIAIQTKDVKSTINWYLDNFECEVISEDKSWALLKFENINIALVSPNEHQPHIAFSVNNIIEYGRPSIHRDGIPYIYKEDDYGNVIELVENNSKLLKENLYEI